MKSLKVFTAVVGLTVAISSIACANVTFIPGNVPEPNEENILLNLGDGPSPTIFGQTNQSHLVVGFDSTTDLLLTPSNGQAKIIAQDGSLNNFTVYVPGGFFTDLILDPQLNRVNTGGPASYDVFANDGIFHYDTTLINGNNFLTMLATNGETISKVVFNSHYGADDLDLGSYDLKQPRISGAALDPSVTPEPSSCLTLALGGLPLLGFLRRKFRV